MRVKEDLRKCVVFLGVESQGEHDISAGGTGFQISYDGYSYLVTAGHVAEALGDGPFVIRVNDRLSGKGKNFHVDGAEWCYHPHYPEVDLAVLEGEPNSPDDDVSSKYDYVNLGEDFLLTEEMRDERQIGPGDRAHVVGLFRLLHGREKNLPVVHTGWIAMMPGDEPIPITHRPTGKTIKAIGYLVEAQTLEGLSGAPVFVDQTWRVKLKEGQVAKVDTNLSLLGVWQGAWDAPPDEVRSGNMSQKGLRVPVGMGIVVPSTKLIELMESPELKSKRDAHRQMADIDVSASMDSVGLSGPPATEDNPDHREDFSQLLNAAVSDSKQGSEK